jgi:hypothetical protein
MNSESEPTTTESSTYGLWKARIGAVLVWGSLLLLIAEPAVATQYTPTLMQSDPGFLCSGGGGTTFLGSIIDNILSFLTVTGIPVFVVLYQLDGVMQFFALGADMKAKIKKHEQNLWTGAAKIYVIPVVLKLLADVLGIDIVGCITLIPFN